MLHAIFYMQIWRNQRQHALIENFILSKKTKISLTSIQNSIRLLLSTNSYSSFSLNSLLCFKQLSILAKTPCSSSRETCDTPKYAVLELTLRNLSRVWSKHDKHFKTLHSNCPKLDIQPLLFLCISIFLTDFHFINLLCL